MGELFNLVTTDVRTTLNLSHNILLRNTQLMLDLSSLPKPLTPVQSWAPDHGYCYKNEQYIRSLVLML